MAVNVEINGEMKSFQNAQLAIEAMQAANHELAAERDAARAAKIKSISLKVSEKGGLSLYGVGRFPVTLYRDQWTRVLDAADSIRAILNAGELDGKRLSEKP